MLCAIRSNDSFGLADALEAEADLHDRDARDLLFACLGRVDTLTEIVRARRRGESGSNKPFGDDARHWKVLSNEARDKLVVDLRSGDVIIRVRTAGRQGRPRVGWTKFLSDGAAIEEEAIRISRNEADVPDWVPECFVGYSSGDVSRGAWARAIRSFIVRRGRSCSQAATETRYAKRALAKWMALRTAMANRD